MDLFEKIGYTCLGLVALAYIAAMLYGMVSVFPFGLVTLLAMLGVGVLLIKVIRERLNNREDDYYNDNIER